MQTDGGDHLMGVGLALATAMFWAVSPLYWASAGRRIGSFQVVLLRSLLASVILLVGLAAHVGIFGWQPIQAGQVLWLVVSGGFGMGLGDVLLYEAMVRLGARRTTQALMLSPVSAVLLGWFCLGEHLSARMLLGITVTLVGTFYAMVGGNHREARPSPEPGRVSTVGVVLAVIGALCTGVGSVTGRQAYALGALNVFTATVIRVVSAGMMIWVFPICRGQTGRTLGHLRDSFVLSRILPGVALGPIAGMFCYLGALKHVEAGVVSTLSSVSPLFILPIVKVKYRARVPAGVVAATVMAVGGVVLIGLR